MLTAGSRTSDLGWVQKNVIRRDIGGFSRQSVPVSISNTQECAAGAIVVVVVVLGSLVAAALVISGGAAFAAILLPFLSPAVLIQLVFTLLLLPLAIFRGTRLLAGRGIRFFSYLLAFTTWLWGLLATYFLWGGLAVLIGLCMAGVGVVPIAVIAFVMEGMWWPAILLLTAIGLILATRVISRALIHSVEDKNWRDSNR